MSVFGRLLRSNALAVGAVASPEYSPQIAITTGDDDCGSLTSSISNPIWASLMAAPRGI